MNEMRRLTGQKVRSNKIVESPSVWLGRAGSKHRNVREPIGLDEPVTSIALDFTELRRTSEPILRGAGARPVSGRSRHDEGEDVELLQCRLVRRPAARRDVARSFWLRPEAVLGYWVPFTFPLN